MNGCPSQLQRWLCLPDVGKQLLDDTPLHLVQFGHPKACYTMKQVLGFRGADRLERPQRGADENPVV